MIKLFRRTRSPVSAEVTTLRLLVADAIDRVLSGTNVTSELEDSERFYEAADEITARDRLANDAVHMLRHWQSDEDIRAKDQGYATAQAEGLRKWVTRLR